MKKLFFFTGLLVSLITFLSSCDDDDKTSGCSNHKKIDQFLNLMQDKDKAMGSVSIVEDGKEVYKKAYGKANLAARLPNSSKTHFRVGSISKSFTAAIIMKLIEDEKLTLETKLNGYYPQIEHATKISIKNLLEHRSGIFNLTAEPAYESWCYQPISKQELLNKMIALNTLSSEPDKEFDYSNSNYILLTYIAEDISGKTYTELLQDVIIKPLGLKDTYYGGRINQKPNEASSYYMSRGSWVLASETDASVPLGAGGIVSTPYDLNLFYSSLFQNKIVSAKGVQQMTTFQDDYSLGIMSFDLNGEKGYGHPGSIDGFMSVSLYFPKRNLTISITNNASTYSIFKIFEGVFKLYCGIEYQLPEFKDPLEYKPEDMDKFVGTYSSPSFPLKFNIVRDGSYLLVNMGGTDEDLVSYELNIFDLESMEIKFKFMPNENKLIFIDNEGSEIEMKKE